MLGHKQVEVHFAVGLSSTVPPNLLKQENVCLIPREAENPSSGSSISILTSQRKSQYKIQPLNFPH